MKKSMLILIQRGTLTETQLAIDMALAASAFEVPLSVVFSDEAVKQLLPTSDEATLLLQKQIKAWPWYDIHSVFVLAHEGSFILPVTLLDPAGMRDLIKQASICLKY
ncbi:MAG: hypothetical protein HY939_03435 [Gammaproteobacteria bacterium]|nr:hypothetical protein [Gammaproteobacteria bacterium]